MTRPLAERLNVPRPRIALYSHDTMGLGHMRRNLLIAQKLADCPNPATVLLIAGARRATAFKLPPGADCLTLPALRKEPDGHYEARRLDMSLAQIIELRARTVRAALRSFDPDLFLVDKEPRGAVRELDPALEELRERGHTRCVLGLRDVLDDPAAVEREWTKAGSREAIEQFYDAVWIYGDPAVYDLVQECRFAPELAARARYTGYLDQRERLKFCGEEAATVRPGPRDARLVFCMLGGGQDGAALAEAFARAELPPSYHGVMVTGPFMDPTVQQRVRDWAASRPRLEVIEFLREPIHLLVHAERIISMGGYNTTCEALSLGKRALIVPRVRPRTEQLIRATTLQRLGLVDMLHPDRLSPEALSAWLASDTGPPPVARGRIDMGGLDRLPGFVSELLGSERLASMAAEKGAGVAR